ncbi:uncharacterized protein BCR38DRAFT_422147 [Pseudomassariella vexata]|uniref:SMP-30/Gluconolactonase/LRE-like region domain-containing protein n=1 Tax=Pseudomassariella vexata TaxID=1141098 RepID=A0A1Y2EGA2_9PEZI|nr:uncharacterized protein BCR38DRAFT_422147 [Pseudomassariella vexata]ORY70447.1 hypothetical protein BCR38DRAFT_422147 [Pseudomassariella vexata]
MKHYTAERFLPSHSSLGESPLYRASDNTLFFVDIAGQRVHTVPLSSSSSSPWDTKHTIALSTPVTRLHVVSNRVDVLAAQTKLGFALLNPQTGDLERIADVHHSDDGGLDDEVRMNDGGIDAKGRWWAGTMALDEESKVGRLWCLSEGVVRDMSTSVSDHESTVPNGPVWSPDDKTMYAWETPQGKVYRYDYDVETGKVTSRQLFVQLEGGGMPDGMAVDVEGHVWVAANSQGKIVRFSPKGEQTAVVEVPGAKMCSCPAFGGEDMKTLFITSIKAEGSTGDVYQVRVDVKGVRRHAYRV